MNTHCDRENSISSQGEGTSKLKGKGIDPRKWGNLNISRESLDIEAQRAALTKSIAQGNKSCKKKNMPKRLILELNKRIVKTIPVTSLQLPENLVP